jgi:RHS repeat-associated protein
LDNGLNDFGFVFKINIDLRGASQWRSVVQRKIVLSQLKRGNLPDPAEYGLSRANTYFVVAMEFLLTPANINVFARRPNGKEPIKHGNSFSFYGDDPIEFEDADSTLHFFFPKDYAYAAADSVTDFSNRVSMRRYFYSDRGKDYMLVGVPWNWIVAAPEGDLIIDPTTNAAASEDVRLYDAGNYGSDTKLAVGKFQNTGNLKARTLISFNLTGIPSNAIVLNAQMKLKYYEAVNFGVGYWVDRWVQAHQMFVSWNEAQATKDNRLTGTAWNATYGKIGGAVPPADDANGQYESTLLFWQSELSELPKWKSWDLTALTQKWLNGTAANYGVMLWATNEDVTGYTMRFHSSEASNSSDRPYLEVVYSTEATTRTVYFLKDHLGSIRATVLDSATAPVIGYDDYDPWGYALALRTKAIPNAYLQGASKNKFTGKERDEEYGLNLDYFGARYYDPLIGRWMVRDPLAEKYPHLSPYVYTFNNPILFFDPNGKYPFTVHVRTFAPFNWFGGGFKGEGENRRFTTERNVASKLSGGVLIESTTMEVITGFAGTARSVGGYGLWSAESEGHIRYSEKANPLAAHLYGNNDAVPFELASDIDVHANLNISVSQGKDGNEILTLSGNITGDRFPAAEAFVKDAQGNAVFLGVSKPGAGPTIGPYKMLPGDPQRPMFKVNVSIIVNAKGQFVGVLVNGRQMSIADWNKQFEEAQTQ